MKSETDSSENEKKNKTEPTTKNPSINLNQKKNMELIHNK